MSDEAQCGVDCGRQEPDPFRQIKRFGRWIRWHAYLLFLRLFYRHIMRLAHRFNWRVAHFRTAQTSRGAWVTPVAGDGAGYPDLCLVRDRVVFAELKSATGRLSDAQTAWAESIHKAGGEFYVWYPKDWDEIERTLRRAA